MAGNSFGQLFRVTTFGESHGPALGCIVDGCPPGLQLSPDDIQQDLDRRRPGQSKHTTQRRESDRAEILSGVFDGVTTGAPIGMVIRNEDQRTRDYERIREQFRPGHADYTYSNPAPSSTPLTAFIDIIALAISASSLSNTGSPNPAGTFVASTLTLAPIESPALRSA